MKVKLFSLVFLILAAVSQVTAQSECAAFQTLMQARDNAGTLHQVLCWDSALAKVSVPTVLNNVAAFPLLAPAGSDAAPSYSFSATPTIGFAVVGGVLTLVGGGGPSVQIDATTGQHKWLFSGGNLQANGTVGQHILFQAAQSDASGVATCVASTVTVTFNTAYASTPTIMLTDETTTGGARVSAKSNSAFTITCTGATDVVDYLTFGNPS